jgi:LPS export ABC transporter permease LptG
MRILDRYVAGQLLPVWIWCLLVFVFLSGLIDLFGHLDEILRYRIPFDTVARYYLNFLPSIIVQASPMALLLSAAFVASRLVRHQELLAMNASGTSLLRASVPFAFIGWLVSVAMFVMMDRVVPRTSAVHERLRQEAFRAPESAARMENVALMDRFNRLYHARALDLTHGELTDLTVLEHDRENQPMKSLYASRAVYTPHGWLLLYGTIYRVGPRGTLLGSPERFVERLLAYPVTPASFLEPEARPETMAYGPLRLMIIRLRQTGITNVRRYRAELASKLTGPLMNMVLCLIGFVGATQLSLRGHLRGLGTSLGWGMAYYLANAVGVNLAKQWPVPVLLMVWAPHAGAVWWCVKRLRTVR